MNRLIFLAVVILMNTGCASAYLTSFNRKEGTVTIAANRWAKFDLIQRQANHACGGKEASLVSGGSFNTGAYVFGKNEAVPVTSDAYTFTCENNHD